MDNNKNEENIFDNFFCLFPENFYLNSCASHLHVQLSVLLEEGWTFIRFHDHVFTVVVVVNATSIVIAKLNMCVLRLPDVPPPPAPSGTLTPLASKLQRSQNFEIGASRKNTVG